MTPFYSAMGWVHLRARQLRALQHLRLCRRLTAWTDLYLPSTAPTLRPNALQQAQQVILKCWSRV